MNINIASLNVTVYIHVFGVAAVPDEFDGSTEERVMAKLEDIRQAVSRNTDATNAAIELVRSISAELKRALEAGDTEAVTALVQQLDTNTENLARAVTENTASPPPQASQPIADQPVPGGGDDQSSAGQSGQ